MSRRRPSGAGSNSRRFATVKRPDGTSVKVPAVKDAGTFVYIRAHDGSWPEASIGLMAYDATWMEEGAVFQLEEMRPGRGMGSTVTVMVVEVRRTMCIFEGKFSQVRRQVLVAEVESDAELEAVALQELESLA